MATHCCSAAVSLSFGRDLETSDNPVASLSTKRLLAAASVPSTPPSGLLHHSEGHDHIRDGVVAASRCVGTLLNSTIAHDISSNAGGADCISFGTLDNSRRQGAASAP